MNNAQLMSALRRKRWWILLGVALCTGLTAYGAGRMKREYLAAATLMPQEQAMEDIRDLARPLEAERERDELAGRQDRLRTVSTVLTSPAILGPVIREHGLANTPVQMEDSLEVREVTSQVLRLTYRDENPERACAVVTAITDRFLDYYTRLRSHEADRQVKILEKERREADEQLRLAGDRLRRFTRSSNISSLQDQTRAALERSGRVAAERNTAEARLREVTAQVATVSAALARTPATREIRESATQSTLLERLRLDVVELKRGLEKELGAHTEEHPSVQRLRAELAEAQRRLDEESRKMAVSVRVIANPERDTLRTRLGELRSERDGLQARVTSLNAQLARIEAEVSGYSGKDVQLSLLTQQRSLAEQRLETATARLGQLRNVRGILAGGAPIVVVDRSGAENPPLDLSQGRTLRLTALAFVMSLALCIALAVAVEMGDRRARSVEDVELRTQLPVIGVVPRLHAGRGRVELATENDPAGFLAESYHFLANHVLRHSRHRESTVLMAATGRPGQGATTALCNLSIALARAGRQVVLVDADLRCPELHRVFDAPPKPGLSEVLRGDLAPPDAIHPTAVPNLRLLSAGGMVRDPWSLLHQPGMARVVEELRLAADYVIFNVPSATVFADALCVAPHADGAVLVVRSREMVNGAEARVRQWLEEAGVPVMGVILNEMPAREMETAEFHRSYTAPRAGAGRPALQPPSAPPAGDAA